MHILWHSRIYTHTLRISRIHHLFRFSLFQVLEHGHPLCSVLLLYFHMHSRIRKNLCSIVANLKNIMLFALKPFGFVRKTIMVLLFAY